MQYRYLDFRYILIFALGWLIFSGCVTPPAIQTSSTFKDPLAVDYKQKESVALLVSKYGDPEIMFSWAGDDFKVEVLRWKKTGLKNERWAIRINDVYKFTWTQFNLEKEKPKNGANK